MVLVILGALASAGCSQMKPIRFSTAPCMEVTPCSRSDQSGANGRVTTLSVFVSSCLGCRVAGHSVGWQMGCLERAFIFKRLCCGASRAKYYRFLC